ncbi:MAG: Rv3235 family protein [Leucobacter sp.]
MTIQRLALYAFEVLEGIRSVAHLGSWITPEVACALAERRAARTERRSAYRDERRTVPTPGRTHVSRPRPDVLEATVVLHALSRATSVVLRFEYLRERWRATVLHVL